MKNNNEYLASGFAVVDSSEEQIVYMNCLNYIDSIPYFKEIKTKTYELLNLEDAHALLEIGCGMGNDIYRIASLMPNKSAVTGYGCDAQLASKLVFITTIFSIITLPVLVSIL